MFEPATRKPKVRLIIDKGSYNVLIQCLQNNEASEYADPTTIEWAEKVLNKIEKYVRLSVSEDGMDSAELRFFDNEAAELIWQLIYHASIDIPGDDFYARLQAEREKKAANNE